MPPTQNRAVLDQLLAIPAAIAWFRDLFQRVHVELTDTGEQFTVIHHGSRLELHEGLDGKQPNFVVPLRTENLSNLLGFFANSEISAYEEFRIVRFMLAPCLR